MVTEHIHAWPGWTEGDPTKVTWWHNADTKHRKYPKAHEVIADTRIKGEKSDRSSSTRESSRPDPEATRAKYKLERVNQK